MIGDGIAKSFLRILEAIIIDSDVYWVDMIVPTNLATIFVINFIVTWKPGLNDLTLYVIILYSLAMPY